MNLVEISWKNVTVPIIYNCFKTLKEQIPTSDTLMNTELEPIISIFGSNEAFNEYVMADSSACVCGEESENNISDVDFKDNLLEIEPPVEIKIEEVIKSMKILKSFYQNSEMNDQFNKYILK